jgi:hypothetical protein
MQFQSPQEGVDELLLAAEDAVFGRQASTVEVDKLRMKSIDAGQAEFAT